MRDLLAGNIALLNQITSLGGTLSLPPSTMNHTRLREVPSLISLLYCFVTYTAVHTSDPLTCDMLAYACLLICEVVHHGRTGLMEYDRVFQRQLAIDSSIPWNILQPSLQAATILGQRTSTGVFVHIVRGVTILLASVLWPRYNSRHAWGLPQPLHIPPLTNSIHQGVSNHTKEFVSIGIKVHA